MRQRATFLGVALLVALGWTLRAQAQSADLGLNSEAVVRGQRGLEAFRERDWATAYDSFRQAETLVHSPVFLLYMARARAEEGAHPEALDLYARVVAEKLPENAPAAWRQAVRQAESESQALRARLEERAAEEARSTAHQSRQAGSPSATPRAVPRPRRLSAEARRAAVIASSAVGAASLVLGVTAGVVALVRFRPIDTRCGPYGCNRADKHQHDQVMTWSRLSDLGFVVAGAGFATAAVFLWVIPGAPAGSSGNSTAGFSARVRF
jgi:hypothetical protein